MITLCPGRTGLAELAAVRDGAAVALDPSGADAIRASAAVVARAAAGEAAIYGVNTGFGKLASTRIDAADTTALQANLVRSHSAGVGPPLPHHVVRLAMALKLLSLGRGASGVRPELVALLEAMLARELVPHVPSQGSVGASGDLAPLAHLALVLMGEGEAWHGGRLLPGAEALRLAGLQPLTLGPKEGLALINGTQISTALALDGLLRARHGLEAALVTGALATDAAMGSPAPFRAEIHALRGQPGQIAVARTLRALMDGSEIRESHREGDQRVQDPYCLRCQPQVAGACLDLLRQAAATLVVEANAVTDNPLVLADGSIVSGGNFHGEPVAFAADQIALAIAELGAITQRRVALLVDPALSFGLPPFLTPAPGLNSGFMIAEVTTAALMSENKQRAAPASVDSTPTSANQEDHVAMACHAARRLGDMVDNLETIVAVEALAAGQGVELRAPLRTSPRLAAALARLRRDVPPLGADRVLSGDMARAAALVRGRALVAAAGADLMPRLEEGGVDQVASVS